LCEETRTKPCHCYLDKKHGGFVVEYECAVVLVGTDNLCAVVEDKDIEAQAFLLHDPESSAVSLANYTIYTHLYELAGFHRGDSGTSWIHCCGEVWIFVIEEDAVVEFVCGEEICDVTRRPGRFVELLDGVAG
jgi:hypothetical protein